MWNHFFQEGATLKVVFAYHSEDPVSQTEMKRHEFKGVKTILLLSSMDKRNIDESGWTQFHFTAKNVNIEAVPSVAFIYPISFFPFLALCLLNGILT